LGRLRGGSCGGSSTASLLFASASAATSTAIAASSTAATTPTSAAATTTALVLKSRTSRSLLHARNIREVQRAEELHGLGIHFDLVLIENRALRNKVHTTLAFLLL